MKILVFSNIRCGGEYFTHQLAETYNLKHIHEPNTIVDFGNNVCVKVHLHSTFTLDQIEKYSNTYDYTFLLDRKDTQEQIKSAYVAYNITKHRTSSWVWREEYLNTKKNVISWKHLEKLITNMSNSLERNSTRLNKEIIYYEDLYYTPQLVDLAGLKFNPDLSKKYFVGNFDKSKLI